MQTFKTRRRYRSAWAHCNTPDGLRNRRAKADARRELLAATLPPIDPGPQPMESWQTVQVLDAHGNVMHSIALLVPMPGNRCDQHAASIDGKRCAALQTATEIGRTVAGWIAKRPSFSLLSEMRQNGVC
jgi:hypothetical protein